MELKALTLTNFRVFKEETEIPFSPLTIITGANSSGKSSVFKALMLLQDNLERNQLARLDFTNGKHVLGTFASIRNIEWDEVVENENVKETITFKLTFENNDKKDKFWKSIKNFIVTLEYCQDKNNLLNGELMRFQIDILENKNKKKQLLKVEKFIEDNKAKLKLDINLAWFILSIDSNDVMPKLMFPIRSAIPIEVLTEKREELVKGRLNERNNLIEGLASPESVTIDMENQLTEKENSLRNLKEQETGKIKEWDDYRDENSTENDIDEINYQIQSINNSFNLDYERIYNDIALINQAITNTKAAFIDNEKERIENEFKDFLEKENLKNIVEFREYIHTLTRLEVSKGIAKYFMRIKS
jgi:predicted ATP-dependent endonuclease of OLD family